MWLSFFGVADAAAGRLSSSAPLARLFSVYVHRDPDAAPPTHPFWRSRLLPRSARVRTDYGNGYSLDRARAALFAYALRDDKRNYKFALLSEACVPVRPLRAVHAQLTADARPRIDEMPPPNTREARERAHAGKVGKRWVPAMRPLVPTKQQLLQARQFLVAGRREVAAWPADADLKALFGGVARAEEHVFYNVVVHALNFSAADVDVGCVTWQRCLTRGSQCSAAVLAAGSYRVPLGCAYNEKRGRLELDAESEILAAAREQRCLFARKFDAKCDLRCLAKSGFRGFQCEGGASPDADVAVTRKQWPR